MVICGGLLDWQTCPSGYLGLWIVQSTGQMYHILDHMGILLARGVNLGITLCNEQSTLDGRVYMV